MQYCVLAFFFLFLSALSVAQEVALDEAMVKIQKKYSVVGLSIVVIKEDKIIFSHGYGQRDIERNLPVDTSTKYRVASISKLVSATALMQLYEKKLFRLEDDVSDYLGFPLRNPHFPQERITFAALLSHTSSLRDGEIYPTFLQDTLTKNPMPGIREILLPEGVYYAPDTFSQTQGPKAQYFQYANLNFGVIASLIEKLSGERFDEYCNKHIFTPLHISCSFRIQDVPDINNVAVLYRQKEGKWIPQAENYQGVYPPSRDLSHYVLGSNGSLFGPQGSLRASAEDLAKILLLHQNGVKHNHEHLLRHDHILKPETLALMHKTVWEWNQNNGNNENGVFMNYALGNHTTNELLPGEVLRGHLGDAYGLLSGLYFSPEHNYGIIFITNGGLWGQGKYSGWSDFEEDVLKTCFDKGIHVPHHHGL